MIKGTIFDLVDNALNQERDKTHLAEHDHKTNPLKISKPINYQTQFEEINKKGVEAFGWDWIRANESAINTASDFGVNYEHPQIRVFMQSIVFAILQRGVTQ